METTWLDILSSVLQAVLAAVLPVLAVAAATWMLAKWKEVKSRVDSKTLDYLTGLAYIVVQAAEQAGAAGLIDEKKAYAMEVVQNWLKSKGMTINVSLIEAAIEAAVLNLAHEGLERKAE